MKALLVVDAQNEFFYVGLRPVPNHTDALAAIVRRVRETRAARHAIAWVRHHNKPHESRAFVPGTWGHKLSLGLGVEEGHGPEQLFEKDVYGAFSGTGLEAWLAGLDVREVLVVG